MSNPGAASSTFSNQQPVNSGQTRRLLASARAANCNALGDTLMPVVASSSYIITDVIFVNASISLTTAAAGIFNAAAGGGTAMVANAALSGNTGPTVVIFPTVVTAQKALTQSAPTLYFNVATAQGAAATMDVFVYGYDVA